MGGGSPYIQVADPQTPDQIQLPECTPMYSTNLLYTAVTRGTEEHGGLAREERGEGSSRWPLTNRVGQWERGSRRSVGRDVVTCPESSRMPKYFSVRPSPLFPSSAEPNEEKKERGGLGCLRLDTQPRREEARNLRPLWAVHSIETRGQVGVVEGCFP